MTKILTLFSLLVFTFSGLFAQGLEGVIVERYYVTNAADSAICADDDGGLLPSGSVTYRVYVDMVPGYKLNSVLGYPSTQNLKILTSSMFFNQEDRGNSTPTFTKTQAQNNLAMLDSYISFGAACAGNFGVLKTEDDGAANAAFETGSFDNISPLMDGPSPRVQDGLLAGTVTQPGTIGDVPLNVVENTQTGGSFVITNGAWFVLGGVIGPTEANRVLIGQFTTDGEFSFELNIQVQQVGGGLGTETSYFARPNAGQVTHPSLIYPPVPGCMVDTACNYSANATQDDGSCLIPVPGCSVCDGAALDLIDTDGDGVCDIQEVPGCTNAEACNYNALATEDNGTCILAELNCTECQDGDTVKVDSDGDGICNAEDVSGFEELAMGSELLTIYPNPAGSQLTIAIEYALAGTRYTYRIADVTGKTLRNGQMVADRSGCSARIDLSALRGGVYMVHIHADGGYNAVRQLIIK